MKLPKSLVGWFLTEYLTYIFRKKSISLTAGHANFLPCCLLSCGWQACCFLQLLSVSKKVFLIFISSLRRSEERFSMFLAPTTCRSSFRTESRGRLRALPRQLQLATL